MSSRFRNLNIGRTLSRVPTSSSKLRVLPSSKSMESLCDQMNDSGQGSHSLVSDGSAITLKSLDSGVFDRVCIARLSVIISAYSLRGRAGWKYIWAAVMVYGL